MSTSLKKVMAITMFVEDPQVSKKFYQSVFDVEAVYEDDTSVAFGFENIIVNLITMPSAHELIEPGVVAGKDAGSRFQLTIEVDEVDEVCAQLAAAGVVLLNGPMNRPWGMRTASFADPDGHIWEVAQEIK
jgi:catechol 2,3-dioxygenase-like lactoylglutathione lyase family enzyme